MAGLAAACWASPLPLVMFPEVFVNGGLMTLLVVYRPEWVSSFLEWHYLEGK